MPLSGNQIPEKRGIDWQAIVRILLVQVLVLLALSGAIVGYLNWSSDAAWKEFTGAGKPSAADPMHHSQFSTPVQRVKGQAPCARSA